MACTLSRIQEQDVAGWWGHRTTTIQDETGYVSISVNTKVAGLIRYYLSVYVAGAGSLNYDIWGTRNEDRSPTKWAEWITKPQNEVSRYGHYITDAACALIHAYLEDPPDVEPPPEPPPDEPPPDPGKPPGDNGLLERVAQWIVDKLNVSLDKVTRAMEAIPQAVADALTAGDNFMGGLFEDIADFISGVATAFTSLKDNIIGAISEMWAQLTAFLESLGEQIAVAVEAVVDKISEVVGDVVEWIKDLGTQIKDALFDAFSWISENIKDMFVDIWEWIKTVAETIKAAIQDGFAIIKEWFSDAIGWIKERFIDIKDAVITGIQFVVEWIRDTVRDIVDGIISFISELREGIAELWENFKEWWDDLFDLDAPEVLERMKKAALLQRTLMEELTKEGA